MLRIVVVLLLQISLFSTAVTTTTAFVLSSMLALDRRPAAIPKNNDILDPLVVCGPSGVGKGTIIQRFLQHADTQFAFGVSHTTRQPRPGERHGVDYFFTSHQDMEQLLVANDDKNNFFLEWAHVHGNTYGTSWPAVQAVQATGKRCLLDIDVQGVQRFKSLVEQQKADSHQNNNSNNNNIRLQPKFVFIAPPSLPTLEDRLRARNTESEESLQRRLVNSKQEVEYGLTPDNFDAIVVNDDLDIAVQEFLRVAQDLYQE